MKRNSIKPPLITACLLGAGVLSLNAQTSPTAESKGDSSTSTIDTNSIVEAYYHPLSLSAEVGTTGAGGSIGWRFSNHLGVHAGMDYFYWSGSAKIEDITYNAKFQPLTETVALDIYPWKRHSFRVSVGIMVDQSELTGQAYGAYALNGRIYTGSLDLNIRPQAVNAYVSIGGNFFYFDHAHHWAMFGELGVAYIGDAQVSLMASDPTASLAVSGEKHKIEDTRKHFPFWPILKLGVTYSF
jgi:hypothetical protein